MLETSKQNHFSFCILHFAFCINSLRAISPYHPLFSLISKERFYDSCPHFTIAGRRTPVLPSCISRFFFIISSRSLRFTLCPRHPSYGALKPLSRRRMLEAGEARATGSKHRVSDQSFQGFKTLALSRERAQIIEAV